MSYEAYLFASILREFSGYFESMPYHTQYDRALELYQEYKKQNGIKKEKLKFKAYQEFLNSIGLRSLESWLKRELSIKKLCTEKSIGVLN
jgi:hypothetical protein